MRKFAGTSLLLFFSTAVGFAQAAAGASHIALRCGWLFDGRGDALRANVFVVIEGEKGSRLQPSTSSGRR